MNLRWLAFDFVDPQLKLSRAQRKLVTARAFAARGTRVRMFAASLVASLAAVVPAFVAANFIGRAMWAAAPGIRPSVWAVQLPFLLSLPLVWIVSRAAVAWAIRPAIRESLHAFGYELCSICGYQLRGLEEFRANCPECGARRRALGCQKCGYVLEGANLGLLTCPECGSDQRVVNDPSRFWWLSFRYAPIAIDLLPDRARRGLRRRAGRASWSWILAGIGLAATGLALLVIAIAAAGLNLAGLRQSPVLQTYVPLLAWPAVALLVQVTYGRALRREIRGLGYDLCGHCGCSLIPVAAVLAHCPECGRKRRPLSADARSTGTLPSPAELSTLGQLAHDLKASAHARHARARWIAVGVHVALIAATLVLFLQFSDPLRHAWVMSCLLLAWIGSLHFWSRASNARALATVVRSEIRRRGHEVCTACGAWQRGMGEHATRCCSECHSARRPASQSESSLGHSLDV